MHQFSCPYTTQQNGLVERKHRHIIESSLSMVFQAKLHLTQRSSAVNTAIFLINRLPSTVLNFVSLWEVLFQSKPDLSQLRIFGCIVIQHKLQFRTTPCLFLGYPPNCKGYICFNRSTSKIYLSRHVLFDEMGFSPFPHWVSCTPSLTAQSWISLVSFYHLCSTTKPSLVNTTTPHSSTPLYPSEPLPSAIPQDVSPSPSIFLTLLHIIYLQTCLLLLPQINLNPRQPFTCHNLLF